MPPFADPDRTTRARIRDAALERFAADGVGATTLTAIARDAGVSAQLAVHHFGSKDGLAAACDDHVLATIREAKRGALARGADANLLQVLQETAFADAVPAYLARRLADDAPAVAHLIDEAVEDSLAYNQQGVDSGVLTPLAVDRTCATILVLWTLGSLTLHRHAARLLGIDLLSTDVEERLAWLVPTVRLLSDGVITPEARDRMLAAADAGPATVDQPDQARRRS